MNDLSTSFNELVRIYPELTAEDFSKAVIDYINTDDFQIRLISSIGPPSREKLAVSKKRVQRYSYNRKNVEVEKLEFLETLVKVKNIIKEQELASPERQNTVTTAPVHGITGPYLKNQPSFLPDGFTNPIIIANFDVRSNGASSVGSIIKKNASDNLMAIKENIQKGIPLTLYSVKELIQIKELYSNNPVIIKELLALLRRDASIRNHRTGKNVIQDFEDFMHQLPTEQDTFVGTKSAPRIAKIDKLVKAVILDELDIVSENLTKDFFQKKISFKEYIEKKNRIYEDANNFWQ